MKFREFWPVYLRAHSLPGTRAMHYVATIVGATAAVQALVSRQPLFLLGIGLGYALAIMAHRYIERNQPLIRVNALLGVVADLRMFWLALTGALGREIADTNPQGDAAAIESASGRDLKAAAKFIRFPLLFISAAGLVAGLLDLDDLVEEGSGLHYPFIQLGAPIAAFTAALGIGIWTMSAVRPRAPLATDAPMRSAMSATEISLWRACVALVVIGAAALLAAEFAEHGLAESTQFYLAFAVLTGLTATVPIILLGTEKAAPSSASPSKPGAAIAVARRLCFLAGAVSIAAGLSMFAWQNAGFAVAIPLFAAGVLLLGAGLWLSNRARKLYSERLFRQYLGAARGDGEDLQG
jgi:hypothetical protein